MPRHEAWLKALIAAAALAPLCVFAADYHRDALARPWRELINDSGLWSMRFLVAGQCLAPLAALTGRAALARQTRLVGLVAAAFAALHVFAWMRQYGFDWSFLATEIAFRIYLTFGAVAVLLLAVLAATSPRAVHARLGEVRWRRLHRLVYPLLAGAFIHYLLARGWRNAEVIADAVLLAAAGSWRLARRYRRAG